MYAEVVNTVEYDSFALAWLKTIIGKFVHHVWTLTLQLLDLLQYSLHHV